MLPSEPSPRRLLMLILMMGIAVLTIPIALIPMISDPTGFAPLSQFSRSIIILAIAAASATPIQAAANAAQLSSTALTDTPRATLTTNTFNSMGWTWSVLTGLIPAVLLALIHRQIRSIVFWCIHGPFQTSNCLEVDYGVMVPQALPDVMPVFLAGVLLCISLTWIATRIGVIVGRRIRHPEKAVTWATILMVCVTLLILGSLYLVFHHAQGPTITPGDSQALNKTLFSLV